VGMDFTIRNDNQQIVLEMRKPFHFAYCCVVWANRNVKHSFKQVVNNAKNDYIDLPCFGPWPFTKEDLRAVLDLAIATEKELWAYKWDFTAERREQYIQKIEELINLDDDYWYTVDWA